MLLQKIGHNRDVSVSSGVCVHEDFLGDPQRDKVKDEYNGSSNLWPIINVWIQHVGYS